jgi:hypothetical protein
LPKLKVVKVVSLPIGNSSKPSHLPTLKNVKDFMLTISLDNSPKLDELGNFMVVNKSSVSSGKSCQFSNQKTV